MSGIDKLNLESEIPEVIAIEAPSELTWFEVMVPFPSAMVMLVIGQPTLELIKLSISYDAEG